MSSIDRTGTFALGDRTVGGGGQGMVAVDATGRGVLVVDRLPAAPAGKTYEAWVIAPGGEPLSNGRATAPTEVQARPWCNGHGGLRARI